MLKARAVASRRAIFTSLFQSADVDGFETVAATAASLNFRFLVCLVVRLWCVPFSSALACLARNQGVLCAACSQLSPTHPQHVTACAGFERFWANKPRAVRISYLLYAASMKLYRQSTLANACLIPRLPGVRRGGGRGFGRDILAARAKCRQTPMAGF